MIAANDQGARRDAKPRANAPQASSAWSIPEIRIVKDDQGRLQIDQADPATYGAYAARQLLAIAEADTRYREGMTKRPSVTTIKITYVNGAGERQEVAIREIFCRMDGDVLVVTHFENANGEKVKIKDLPISAPQLDELDDDVDDMDRLHQLAMAELGDAPSAPSEIEPEYEAPRPTPPRERRMPTGPLRQYDKPADPAPTTTTEPLKTSLAPEPAPAPRGPAAAPPVPKATAPVTVIPAKPALRSLNEGEATALRALIEAKTSETRWAGALLMQAAERHPSDRKLQNEHLANLLWVSLDSLRAESRTPLGVALRGILEEIQAFKSSMLDRDPLKTEKVALQPFARLALAPTPVDDGPVKTVSGTAQRTPAQVLAKLEDPKLARAVRVKFLMEVVPELIESWKPDKESTNSEAANESSPAIVRRMFAVANEQRQQRKYIDDGPSFKKAGEKYKGLQDKLPKDTPTDGS